MTKGIIFLSVVLNLGAIAYMVSLGNEIQDLNDKIDAVLEEASTTSKMRAHKRVKVEE